MKIQDKATFDKANVFGLGRRIPLLPSILLETLI